MYRLAAESPDLREEHKRELRRLRTSFRKLALREQWHQHSSELSAHCMLLLLFVVLLVSVLFVSWYVLEWPPISVRRVLLFIVFAVTANVVSALVFLLVVGPVFFLDEQDAYWRRLVGVGWAWALIVVTASAAGVYHCYYNARTIASVADALLAGIGAGTAALFMAAAAVLAWVLITKLLLTYLNHGLLAASAHAVLVRHLLRALATLREEVVNRHRLFVHLKGAATCLDQYLPNALRTGDVVTDYWIQSRLHGVASGLRVLARRVVTPTETTYGEVTVSLSTMLGVTVMRQWGLLAPETGDVVPPRQALRARLVAAVRSFTIAGIPLVTVAILQRVGISVPDYVATGALLWVVGTLVLWLDPDLRVLAAFRQWKDAVGHGRKE
jgi:hypothetical protein